jgi:hypothetical protein
MARVAEYITPNVITEEFPLGANKPITVNTIDTTEASR